LQPGDVQVGDRAFGSYAHLALGHQHGLHAVFRPTSGGSPRRPRIGGHLRQAVARPTWLTAEEYAALPVTLTVREIRDACRRAGGADAGAGDHVARPPSLPGAGDRPRLRKRWQVETHLGELKSARGWTCSRARRWRGCARRSGSSGWPTTWCVG
jgi:hypothetical protein